MENRKETLTEIKMCRFCLTQTSPLKSLYTKNKDVLDLKFKVLSCLSYEVFPSDKMPTYICERCKFFMNTFYEFKKICRQSDELVLRFLRTGKPWEPLAWPKALTKVFDSSKDVMKTVIEGGTTVQVSSQDTSESEDEEANIYNIQIGEDDEAKTTQVKIVTTDSVEDNKKKKGFGSVSKLSRHLRTHATGKPYPCKYCSKSFVKSQHYTRHLRVKHHDEMRSGQSPPEDAEMYRCDQCEETFAGQDELIFHSAVHATQNLTCPLCQEKFDNVDDVTAHIKSHVNGVEFMCEFCELVFVTKEKYENHLMLAHEEEINNDVLAEDESLEIDGEDYDDDAEIKVKEDGDSMVIEINKFEADNLLMSEDPAVDEDDLKQENTNSECSDIDMPIENVNEPVQIEVSAAIEKISMPDEVAQAPKIVPKITVLSNTVTQFPLAEITQVVKQPVQLITAKGDEPVIVTRKVEEKKSKVEQLSDQEPAKKEKTKVENTNSAGFTDKSLRLLEKELQDLKRTNAKPEIGKTQTKTPEVTKLRRTPVVTSTPKLKSTEEKKQLPIKSPAIEKKFERRITKENKEPSQKEGKNDNSKEESKEEKKEKERETPKSVIKNGSSDKEENIRRSSRPSRVRDYAKMVKDSSKEDSNDEDDTESEEDDEEYTETSISEVKSKRRYVVKPKPQPVASPAPGVTPAPRKRGRPRKDAYKEVPEKVRKEDSTSNDGSKDSEEKSYIGKKSEKSTTPMTLTKLDSDGSKTPSDVILSPTGQTLKKVPIKALPPGVRPLPLRVNARAQGELCEMQIGEKFVKVQKIVMSKSDVEVMAKQGLLEMKDGNMVLKQGIKLPTKTINKDNKEAPKKEKSAPTRCDLGE